LKKRGKGPNRLIIAEGDSKITRSSATTRFLVLRSKLSFQIAGFSARLAVVLAIFAQADLVQALA
jgi:hypothetical protein